MSRRVLTSVFADYEKFEKIMEEKGFTIREVSDNVLVDHLFFTAWKRKKLIPDPGMLYGFANFLKCKMEDFMTERPLTQEEKDKIKEERRYDVFYLLDEEEGNDDGESSDR